MVQNRSFSLKHVKLFAILLLLGNNFLNRGGRQCPGHHVEGLNITEPRRLENRLLSPQTRQPVRK
jgi:hypothetical protein